MTNEGSQGWFIEDYYETLQVSSNADFETIERVYRFLAKRYHPDNPQTGDAEKFKIAVEAFSILSDPEKRAAYDVRYERARTRQRSIFVEMPVSDRVETDRRIRDGVLSLLYSARA
jgi:DnaJ-class molecular chaperone